MVHSMPEDRATERLIPGINRDVALFSYPVVKKALEHLWSEEEQGLHNAPHYKPRKKTKPPRKPDVKESPPPY